MSNTLLRKNLGDKKRIMAMQILKGVTILIMVVMVAFVTAAASVYL